MANPNNPNTGKTPNRQDPNQPTPRRDDDKGRDVVRNPNQPSERDIEGEIPGNRNADPADPTNPDVTERRPHREQR